MEKKGQMGIAKTKKKILFEVTIASLAAITVPVLMVPAIYGYVNPFLF